MVKTGDWFYRIHAQEEHRAIIKAVGSPTHVSEEMSDPRNVAHDKKVKQEKQHHKPDAETPDTALPALDTPPTEEHEPGELEKSTGVLSRLKEMEFHSRANIETLAELMLTIEDDLKQKEFSASIEAVYSDQDRFHTKIAALILSYGEKCESLKPTV